MDTKRFHGSNCTLLLKYHRGQGFVIFNQVQIATLNILNFKDV